MFRYQSRQQKQYCYNTVFQLISTVLLTEAKVMHSHSSFACHKLAVSTLHSACLFYFLFLFHVCKVAYCNFHIFQNFNHICLLPYSSFPFNSVFSILFCFLSLFCYLCYIWKPFTHYPMLHSESECWLADTVLWKT